ATRSATTSGSPRTTWNGWASLSAATRPRTTDYTRSVSDLVAALQSPHGWWRDTAQLLIVCRDDRSVTPQLKQVFLSSPNPLARLIALRILKTFGALELKHILAALKDSDERVRVHGICLSEELIETNSEVFEALSALVSDKSLMVMVQLYSSLNRNANQKSIDLRKLLVLKHPKHKTIELLEAKRNEFSIYLHHLRKYKAGHKIYQSLCVECHGKGNKGITQMGKLMAPKFTGNKRIQDKEYFTKVILKGIHGPLGVKKETFSEAMMPPLAAAYDDQQIADVINYITRRWARSKKDITVQEIAEIRKKTSARTMLWTYKEILQSMAKLKGSKQVKEAKQVKQGFTSLFDGKTLKGWSQKNGKATYVVKDGTILGTTADWSPNSFLCTEKQYADFELTFEVLLDGRLNSGVQIRSATKDGTPAGRVNGPQVELAINGNAGYLYGEGISRGWITPAKDRQKHKNFVNKQWNKFHIIAQGKRIQVWVNGAQVSDLKDEAILKSHPKGFIGLQVHGVRDRGPFTAAWRNIHIKEL
ncbi:MAG: DUF1080 domain-containing protein, partial [Lentisphaeraceae bacterium]|nr:DUF1080 domain-containing protein [Lentisphaeraceae bacterium]